MLREETHEEPRIFERNNDIKCKYCQVKETSVVKKWTLRVLNYCWESVDFKSIKCLTKTVFGRAINVFVCRKRVTQMRQSFYGITTKD